MLVDDSKIEDPFVADPKETKVVVDLENALTAFDAIGACKFMGLLLPASDYVELINYALGWDMDVTNSARPENGFTTWSVSIIKSRHGSVP